MQRLYDYGYFVQELSKDKEMIKRCKEYFQNLLIVYNKKFPIEEINRVELKLVWWIQLRKRKCGALLKKPKIKKW